jgi:hypothetical protein
VSARSELVCCHERARPNPADYGGGAADRGPRLASRLEVGAIRAQGATPERLAFSRLPGSQGPAASRVWEVAIRRQGGTPELLEFSRLPETNVQSAPPSPHGDSPSDRLMKIAQDGARGRNGGLGPGRSFTWTPNRCCVFTEHRIFGSYIALRRRSPSPHRSRCRWSACGHRPRLRASAIKVVG